MRVRFLRDCHYPQNNAADSRTYKAGETYDLDRDHALRWIRRRAAEEVADEPKPKVVRGRTAEAMVPAPPAKGE